MTDFTGLGLHEVLLRALDKEGYARPTPIQLQSIPALLAGHDLLGLAQTGTGKTAAFALPILHQLLTRGGRPTPGKVRALVLAPTRELAAQIAASFKAYSKFARISVGVVFGGVSMGPQIDMLRRGLDILVATPGRLLDHMDNGRVKLDETDLVVFDEADHMLDLGFIVPIRRIVARLPKARQTMFFSATMPSEIQGLADELLRNPVRAEVTPVATTAERIDQRVFLVDPGAKRELLIELASDPKVSRAIVFTRTKRGADRVSMILEEAGIPAGAIHGNKSQNHRQRTLEAFRSGRTRMLVATDIAARGIDIDGVSHVFNFELPETPEQYVHRIGRTARAGREGIAISLCDNGERNLLRAIEKLTRQQIPHEDRRNPATRDQHVAPPKRGGQGRQRKPEPASYARTPQDEAAYRRKKTEGRPQRAPYGEGRPAFGEKRDGAPRPAFGEQRAAGHARPEHRDDRRGAPARKPQGEQRRADAKPFSGGKFGAGKPNAGFKSNGGKGKGAAVRRKERRSAQQSA